MVVERPATRDDQKVWDVIVIGGGAAGLMAAASAAQLGKTTLLLEKNRKFGVKILMSGGTRCNITHNTDARGIVEAFGRNGKFLHSALSAMSPSDCVQLFNSLGVETKVESTGKVFPVSNKAIDVRDALVRYATESGASLHNECAVTDIQKQESGRFLIEIPDSFFLCHSVVVTTGGLSFPGCGTTGDGYPWAENFGHTIIKTVPALTPLLSNCQWANELKGVTIDPTCVEVWEPNETPGTRKNRKPISSRTASLLFTHFGFSGPAAMDVSRAVASHEERKSLTLTCDFLPNLKATSIEQQLIAKKNLLDLALPFVSLTRHFRNFHDGLSSNCCSWRMFEQRVDLPNSLPVKLRQSLRSLSSLTSQFREHSGMKRQKSLRVA